MNKLFLFSSENLKLTIMRSSLKEHKMTSHTISLVFNKKYYTNAVKGYRWEIISIA